MYYYLVDSAQYDGKNFEFFQTQLLSLLGEYHISGEVARVTRLRTVEDLVATAVSHGVTTLVIVGNDETFDKAVTVCHDKPITLGFVPVCAESEVARILGAGDLLESVITIAKRRVESLDLACVEQTYFISNLFFQAGQATPQNSVESDKSLQAQAETSGRGFCALMAFLRPAPTDEVEMRFDRSFTASGKLVFGSIINTRDRASERAGVVIGNPKDGLLDVVFVGRMSRFDNWKYRKVAFKRSLEALPGASVVHAREIEILSPTGLKLFTARKQVASAPARIFIADKKIRVIVGKNRSF